MSTLLNSIDKVPYQTYTLKHGIEIVKIQVPLKEATLFEAAFSKLHDSEPSMTELMKLVRSYDGFVRSKAK